MEDALQEGQRRLKEEQQRREEGERRLEEERQRREQVEATAQSSILSEFLEQCHDLHTSIEVVTDKSLTTQGDVTNPDNRLYPKRILPWHDFDASQAAVWARVSEDSEVATRRCFPSKDNFFYERSRLRAISSESALRRFEAVATENMVSDLFRRARTDAGVRQELGLESEINFQDYTNLGDEGNVELAQTMQDLRLQQNTKRSERQQSPYRHRGTADQFCILQSEDDGSRGDSLLSGASESVTAWTPDVDALVASGVRLVVAAGEESARQVTGRSAQALAERLGLPLTMFPSHHGGFLGPELGWPGQPEAFAARLRSVLDGQVP